MIVRRIKKNMIGWSTRFVFIRVLALMALDKIFRKKIILIQISTPGFVQFVLPTFLELRKRFCDLSFYLCLKYPVTKHLAPFGLSCFRYFPEKICPQMVLADAFLMTEIYDQGPAQAVRIMLGHGQPVKHERFPPEQMRNIDVYFLYGSLMEAIYRRMESAMPNEMAHITPMNTGNPKTDCLYDGSFSKAEVLMNLRLDPQKHTFLYAPAWDPGSSLREYGKEIISTLLRIPNANIIVKLHPVSMEPKNSPHFEFYTGGIVWQDELSVFSKHPNFLFFSDYNINPLLVAADVMITDFSGVGQTFMTLDKPVIFFDCPVFYENTTRARGYNPDEVKNNELFNAGRNYGVVVSTLNELYDQAIFAAQNPNHRAEKRRELSEKMTFNRGKAAQVTAKTIHEIIESKENYMKLSPELRRVSFNGPNDLK